MRLIDVDKIEINEECTFSGKGIKDFLNAIPTACDVDKILEQLEEERNPMYRTDGSLMSEKRLIEIDKAVEIVKSGGIAEEKKAEWKEHFTSRFERIE